MRAQGNALGFRAVPHFTAPKGRRIPAQGNALGPGGRPPFPQPRRGEGFHGNASPQRGEGTELRVGYPPKGARHSMEAHRPVGAKGSHGGDSPRRAEGFRGNGSPRRGEGCEPRATPWVPGITPISQPRRGEGFHGNASPRRGEEIQWAAVHRLGHVGKIKNLGAPITRGFAPG